MEQYKGTIKTVVTTIIALILVGLLANLILWQIYKMNICEPLYTTSTNAGYTYDEDAKTYTSTIGKIDASIAEPTTLKFDCTIAFAEKSSNIWKVGGDTKQILITYEIIPKVSGSFEYRVCFEDITGPSSTIKNDRGYVTIDPNSLSIDKDNTTNSDGSTLVSTYTTRIQKLITTANDVYGIDIQ